jgi:ATP-dependent DNA helicase RecQ
MASADPILTAARQVFGYRALRPGQREAVESVLGGRDTLAVLATGGGKSAIYALAGHLLQGPTLVISPLIALQRDQVAALQGRGEAVAINSSSGAREHRGALERLAHRPEYVFLAPEQLSNSEVLHEVARMRPALLAVDEAHLVSQWGPDFRPDYLRIGQAAEAIGRPVILALTATAAPQVREEIIRRLGMRDPAIMIRGFARSNIKLAVHSYFTDEAHKLEVIGDDVMNAAAKEGHGIVYGATHKRVETLAQHWSGRGLRAAAYHAGLPASRRLEVEDRFRHGDLDVVVATIAFGMGVDKPDIRWVFHADVSGSPDEYYQEFGRAGRDGGPANAVLYYRSEDLRLPRMYASSAGPSVESLRALATALAGRHEPADLTELRQHTHLSSKRIEESAMALADASGVAIDADGRIAVTGDLDEAIGKAIELIDDRRVIERTRTDTMGAYAEYHACRWKFLLEYLGEPAPDRCGHCDNDELAAAITDEANAPRPFPRGSRIRHPVFGKGDVVGYPGSRILIAFDSAGYKSLDLGLVRDGDLLEKVDEIG